MSWLSSLIGLGGNALGSWAGSALEAHSQRDLMDRQNRLNNENWERSLSEGPTREKEGLLAAGYNPLLAIGGYDAPSIGGVSIPGGNGLASSFSQTGNSALENFKKSKESKNTETDTTVKKETVGLVKKEKGVKDAQKRDLEATAKLKEAQATKTKVDTFTDPVRTAVSVGGAIGTAYGAKKVADSLRGKTKPIKIPTKGPVKKLVDKVAPILRRPGFGVLALPSLIGGSSAYGLHRLYESSKPGSNVRRLFDEPLQNKHW